MEYRIWRSGEIVRIEAGNGSIELSDSAAVALGRELTPPPLPLPLPRRGHHRWSDQEAADIKSAYEVGLGVSQIARRYGVSRTAMYTLLDRIGAPPRNQKQADASKQMWAARKAAQ